MPSDDYASFSGSGALKLKGGKIVKTKKKRKDKTATDLSRSLSTGEAASDSKDVEKKKKQPRAPQDDDIEPEPGQDDLEGTADDYKTEAQRRHEEIQRKKMLKLAESISARPELLKTHKERVEELNTYLSKLSEHHDMPKIGPG